MLLVVHGGAGDRRPTKKALRKLYESLSTGYEILNKGGSALDAVEKSITVLEDSGIFNAGLGGNLQFDGARRLDASLMDGKDLKAGSVIGIEGIRNPIKVARIIMNLPHVIFTNKGAGKIAETNNLELLPEPDKKVLEKFKTIKKRDRKIGRIYEEYFSTVGAVAFDKYGNLAAGTSTGGIKAMLPGRVGDSPIIGAGIYAENSLGAVSCTGSGEHIIRLSLAKEICMGLKDILPLKAASISLKRLFNLGGSAGVIVINNKGKFVITHSTRYMPSGYIDGKGVVVREGFKKI